MSLLSIDKNVIWIICAKIQDKSNGALWDVSSLARSSKDLLKIVGSYLCSRLIVFHLRERCFEGPKYNVKSHGWSVACESATEEEGFMWHTVVRTRRRTITVFCGPDEKRKAPSKKEKRLCKGNVYHVLILRRWGETARKTLMQVTVSENFRHLYLVVIRHYKKTLRKITFPMKKCDAGFWQCEAVYDCWSMFYTVTDQIPDSNFKENIWPLYMFPFYRQSHIELEVKLK